MATIQDMDQDAVRPMSKAEHMALVERRVPYSQMTPMQQRSWMKKAEIDHVQLHAEFLVRYKRRFGKIKESDPPKTAEEMLGRIRLKFKKGSPEDALYQSILGGGESAVDTIRHVRGN